MTISLKRNNEILLQPPVIRMITSKSHIHRLLIAGALCKDSVHIITNIISGDMQSTMDALKLFGAEFDLRHFEEGYEIIVSKNINTDNRKRELRLNCGESGSTARFLLPLGLVAAESLIMEGEGTLNKRPMEPLLGSLRENNIDIVRKDFPIKVKGSLEGGRFVIRGDISSQYISGLLFALPLCPNNSTIEIINITSTPYIDLTIQVLYQFGIEISKKDNLIFIKGKQRYKCPTPGTVTGEGDYSNGAVFVASKLLAGYYFQKKQDDYLKAIKDMRILGLRQDSLQGDKKAGELVDYILKASGEKIIDAGDIPDLIPVLAVTASLGTGTVRFTGVSRLRWKESDRLESTMALLRAVGCSSYVEKSDCGEEEVLVVEATTVLDKKQILVDSFMDHRIIMAASLYTVIMGINVDIENAQAINKSFPGFFEYLSQIGVQVYR